MKLILAILITGLFFINADVIPQSYSLSLKNKPLREVLQDVENRGNYHFFFSDDVSNLNRLVQVNVTNATIEQLLDQVLKPYGLGYQMLENNLIVISPYMSALQDIVITGTVTEADGQPVPGVNVRIKGTNQGAITDVAGKYTINVPDGNATLVFSFIGYITQEFLVGSQRAVNVVLSEGINQLEEVVVVGYGTMKREAVTGSVSRANLAVYEKVPSNNILDRIKGSVAGLNIDGTNRAGAVSGMIIRGQNSPTAGNSPLIVVDGAIFAGSLADISPYDVENLTVLKDASAAAVYGSRSANGVILIETKRGQGSNGKAVFNLDMNYGICNQLQSMKLYEGKDYLQRVLDIRELLGQEADPSKIEMYLQEEERKNYLVTPDHRPTITDPYNVLTQESYNRNMNFSVTNRLEKVRYYAATSVIDQQGIEINDQYKYLSARINIDSDITDWLNVGIKSFYSHRNTSGSLFGWIKTFLSPYGTLKDPDGAYVFAPQTTTSAPSPFWYIATDDKKLRNNLNGIVTATVKAPWVKGLSYISTLSNTLRWQNNRQFWDDHTVEGRNQNGTGFREARNYYNLLWDNMIKFNRTFVEKHAVDVTLLFSQEKYEYEYVRADARDFDNMTLGTYGLSTGKTQTVSTGGQASEAIGLMARGTYTWNNKYSLTGTIRRDGYSAFSKNKKYGTFPSVGVNWNISRESFMENISYLDNLALRATYGSNGNQSISLYQTLARIANDRYLFDGPPTSVITQSISSLATDDLGWETTTGLNLGLDFGWLNGRINGSVDVYRTKTNNMIFSLPLPSIAGLGSIYGNVGEIQNRGIEISLNTLTLDRSDFKWYSNFAFSLNRNKVVSIFGDKDPLTGKEGDLVNANYFMGKSLGAVYGYKITGMYQQADADNGSILNGWRPGEYIIKDLDNSGTITSDKDRQILGYTKENFRWSLTNSFLYKGFSLMVYLNSIWGGNGWYLSTDNNPGSSGYRDRPDINHPVYDFWTPRNTDAFFPRVDYGRTGAVTAYKPIDRSFIKLQKISLTYNVGKWLKMLNVNDLTVGVSADNLYTFAPYWIGLDPETNQGMHSGGVPSIRTYNFSVSLKF